MGSLYVPILKTSSLLYSSLYSVTCEKQDDSRFSVSRFNGYADDSVSSFNKKLGAYFTPDTFSFKILKENEADTHRRAFKFFSEQVTSISLGLLCAAYKTAIKRTFREKYESITVTGDFKVVNGDVHLVEVKDIGEKYKLVQNYASKHADKQHLFIYISSEEIIPDGLQENNVLVIRYDSSFPVGCVFADVFEDIEEDTSTQQKYRNEFIETKAFIKLKKEFIRDKSCNCHIIKGKSNTGKSVAAEALCKYLVNSQTISGYAWLYIGDNGKLLELLRKEKEELGNSRIGTDFFEKQEQRSYIKEAYPEVFDAFERLLQTDRRCAIVIDNIEHDIVDEVLSFFNQNYPTGSNIYHLIITSWEGSRINRIESSIRTRTIDISDISLDFKELKAIAGSVLKINDYSKKYSEAPESSKNELLKLLFRLCKSYPGYIPIVLSALNKYSIEEALEIYSEKDASDLSSIDKILTVTFATVDFLSRIVLFAYLQIKNFDDALKADAITAILKKKIFNNTQVIDYNNDIRSSLNVLQQYSFLREINAGYYEIKSAVLDFAVFSKDVPDELRTARDLIITPERKVEYAIEGKKLDEFKLYIDMISEKETLNDILIKLCKSDSSLEFFEVLLSKGDVDVNYTSDYGIPLQICAETTTDTRILDFLIAKGADKEARNSVGMSLLHYATENKNSTVLNYILKKRWFRDINEKIDDPLEDGLNPIQLACATSKDAKSIELLRKHGANLDVKSKNGVTLLHYAAENDDCTVLEYLLELKNNPCGNINETDIYGWTPLHWACAYCKNTKSIELLRKYGADFKVRCGDGWNLLHFTVKFSGIYGNSTVLKYLLDNPIGGGINEADNHGVTPLHIACESSTELIELLLKYDADPKIVTSKGNNILHVAVLSDKKEIVEYILKNLPMVDPAQKNLEGKTPAELATSDDIKKLFEK